MMVRTSKGGKTIMTRKWKTVQVSSLTQMVDRQNGGYGTGCGGDGDAQIEFR